MAGRSWVATYVGLLVLYIYTAFLAHSHTTLPGEVVVFYWLTSLDWSSLHALMAAISFLGTGPVSALAVVAVVLLLLWKRHRLEVVFVALLPLFAAGLSSLSKELVARPRPPGVTGDGSFPSGHVVYAVAFYGLLCFLMPHFVQGTLLKVFQAGLLLLIGLMMVSRVYLGAHWPSDVLGGLMLGSLALLPAIFIVG